MEIPTLNSQRQNHAADVKKQDVLHKRFTCFFRSLNSEKWKQGQREQTCRSQWHGLCHPEPGHEDCDGDQALGARCHDDRRW